jgi:inosine/xanthosine triphosphatase
MKSITIGSKNFAKVEAVKKVFIGFEVIGLSVPSEVSEQPFSDEETMKGALNRANHAMKAGATDIGIGLEGGVMELSSGLYLCNWGALVDKSGFSTVAGGARIKLPDEIADELRNGRELGPVMDDYAKKRDVRKLEGAVGILTNEKVNRLEMFEHVVKLLAGQYEYNSIPLS